MIKTLRVKNYLSLKDVELKLGLRNILVGPNMAGKSNLVDSLRFLSSVAVVGVKKALMDRGGFQEVFWKGKTNATSRISFELVVEIPAQGKEPNRMYDYLLDIHGSQTGHITVAEETLRVRILKRTHTLIDFRSGRGTLRHVDGTIISRSLPDPTTSALESNIPGWEGNVVRNWVSMWRFYQLSPSVMKQPNAPSAQNFLNEAGENFSSWMNTLRNTFPENYALVRKAALDVFPELTEVLTPPTQFGTTVVMTHEKHLRQPILLWRMSDGMLSFLALLSLIFAPNELGAPLYCVEEPENHLHPTLLKTLIEILKQRQNFLGPRAAQVIITTHSPLIVDSVEIEELIVLERHSGATRCLYPASKQNLRKLLSRKGLGLGDLWYSGALGGR